MVEFSYIYIYVCLGKQCIIFAKKFLADYTSKYCLLSIPLTSACIYTPQHTNFGCSVWACC